jgi:hypothetical protein
MCAEVHRIPMPLGLLRLFWSLAQGGILLRIKELQSFESETILAFYNIFTATPKKYILQEFRTILQEAQETTQELDPTNFFWPMTDLPNNSTLPALEIRLQNPKLPG